MSHTYGDSDNVKRDVVTLTEIISRQGTDLLLDVVAEYIGKIALNFSLNSPEISLLKKQTLAHLYEAMNERT